MQEIWDVGLIPVSGRSLGGGHGNPFQYSCLENPMDRGAWWAAVHRVAKSQTWLKWLSIHACICIYKASSRSSWSFTGLRKEGHLLRSGRAGTRRRKFDLHGWAGISAIGQIQFMHNTDAQWQPTPVFLPEESHGHRSLAGYSPWGHKESDMTEWLRWCILEGRKEVQGARCLNFSCLALKYELLSY